MVQLQRVSAYAILLDEGRILLCRVSSHISAAQEWTLPGGGIDFGEAPLDAAIREVREETGLEVTIAGDPFVNSELLCAGGGTMHAIRMIYRGRVTGGVLTHEADGSTDRCEWFSAAEASRLPLVSLARVGLELAFGTSRI